MRTYSIHEQSHRVAPLGKNVPKQALGNAVSRANVPLPRSGIQLLESSLASHLSRPNLRNEQ